jgi:hypothetical protein
MFSNPMTMRVMADKYRRLAEQQTGSKKREKYRAYARIYSEIANRIEQHHERGGVAANQARRHAGRVH